MPRISNSSDGYSDSPDSGWPLIFSWQALDHCPFHGLNTLQLLMHTSEYTWAITFTSHNPKKTNNWSAIRGMEIDYKSPIKSIRGRQWSQQELRSSDLWHVILVCHSLACWNLNYAWLIDWILYYPVYSLHVFNPNSGLFFCIQDEALRPERSKKNDDKIRRFNRWIAQVSGM